MSSRRDQQNETERPERGGGGDDRSKSWDNNYQDGGSYDYIGPSDGDAAGQAGVLMFSYCEEHERRYPSGGKCPLCP